MSRTGLGRNRVVDLLAELERRLNEQGLNVRIRVVGGSAMLLHGLIDRATEDIDAYYSHRTEVEKIIEAMAAEHGLPKKWLNSSAAAFIPDNASWAPAPDSILSAVEVADLPTLTAMKLAAERDKDILDLGHLVNALRLSDTSELLELAYDKYGEDSIPLSGSRQNYEIVAEEAITVARRLRSNKNP
ncbi:hypothetical protein M2368_002580 [Arthrobacter sp. JUb119]|uniref:DUF6036 family nucleotidyltransferase n=1 Tax=Micrococcaceae TaxID=1268 RepID=UPI000FA2898D|nr:DUF6036 family nucleotidyltransferase [Arthrobacter sp. JUb115]MCS3493568.1 hypothetical protein [Arthrobacter sp. JUb119]TDU18216.1 hypothetical protein EDF61_1177 [Arthrobacter sp. JUb115]